MNQGRMTVWIGEREALPVRAIPYVTGWAASPDQLAKDLSQPLSKDFSRLRNLVAYHLVGDVPTVVAAREWDATVVKLNALEATLKQEFPDHDIGFAAWREAAALQFPKEAFVWLDEFKAQFDAWTEEKEFFTQRPGDNELVLTAMLDDQVIQMVLEGFAPSSVAGAQLTIESDATTSLGIDHADVGNPQIGHASRVEEFGGEHTDSDEELESLPTGLTTSELIDCFGGYMGVKNPAKVLSEYPVWATKSGALIQRGRRGKPSKTAPDISAWHPVQFALNLLNKNPLPVVDGLGDLKQQYLDTAFSMKSLNKWKPIWARSKPL
jgi:hypothetical protein